MNFLKLMLAMLGFAFATSPASAKINNSKTVTAKVLGNCEMCKQRIEKAGNLKNQAQVTWHEKTDEVTISYDTIKTTSDEILKRIAYAGYDNEKYVAPDEAYAKLPGCCKYDRELLPNKKLSANSEVVPKHNMSGMQTSDKNTGSMKPENAVTFSSRYNEWLDAYLAIWSALAADNGKNASTIASEFLGLINDLPMDKMSDDQHKAWMKNFDKLKSDAQVISVSKDITKQRAAFSSLSANVAEVVKVFKLNDKTVYEQFCPMYNDNKGAYWISDQAKVKNPYYGKAMLMCGSTKETIETK